MHGHWGACTTTAQFASNCYGLVDFDLPSDWGLVNNTSNMFNNCYAKNSGISISGGDSFSYYLTYNNTLVNGDLSFNNDNYTLVSEIEISKTAIENVNVLPWYSSFNRNNVSRFKIYSKTNPYKYIIFALKNMSMSDYGTFVLFNVQYISHNGFFNEKEIVTLSYIEAGTDLEPRMQTVEGEIDTLQSTVAGIETLLAAI